MKDSILSVQNLSLMLNGHGHQIDLVKNVSFDIRPRQVMGLIGESGCGKSLTCLAVMGQLPRNVHQVAGRIVIDGKPIQELHSGELRALRSSKVAMILQNPMSCFDAVFTIKHHFLETLEPRKTADPSTFLSISRKALAEVGFDDPDTILDLYPFQMSGGMLQRVMVALAIVVNASLLIADEPTTDLDVVSQARILDLLARMRAEFGMSILLITHDLSVIARLADDVAVMTKEGIVESTSVMSLFHHPAHDYTKALLQAHHSLYSPKLLKLLGVTAESAGLEHATVKEKG